MMEVRRLVRPITGLAFGLAFGGMLAPVWLATEGKTDVFGYAQVAAGFVLLVVGVFRCDLVRLKADERKLHKDCTIAFGKWRADEVIVATRLCTRLAASGISTNAQKHRLGVALGVLHASERIARAQQEGKDWSMDERKFILFDLEALVYRGDELREEANKLGKSDAVEYFDKRLSFLRMVIVAIKSGAGPSVPKGGKRKPKRAMRKLGFDFGGLAPAGAPA